MEKSKQPIMKEMLQMDGQTELNYPGIALFQSLCKIIILHTFED